MNQGYKSFWGISICIREWNHMNDGATFNLWLFKSIVLFFPLLQKGGLWTYTLLSDIHDEIYLLKWPLLFFPLCTEIYIKSVKKLKGNYILQLPIGFVMLKENHFTLLTIDWKANSHSLAACQWEEGRRGIFRTKMGDRILETKVHCATYVFFLRVYV